MINYKLRQYQILIDNGYRQAPDGSWHMENELELYCKIRKETLEPREKLVRSNMLSKDYLTTDFSHYYNSAESLLRKMNS
jgi:hypothetical protein